MNQDEYIEKHVEIDYIIKSKNSSLTFGLVAIVFIFLNYSSNFKIPLILLSILVIIISILRMVNVNRYLNKRIERKRATKNVTISVIVNGTLWSIIGFLTVLSYKGFEIRIFITFILLLAFIAGSIITVSSKRLVLIIFNLMMFAPITFYCLKNYEDDKDILFLIIFNVLNLTYTLNQSRVVYKELIRRLKSEYELKKSLEELAQSKKKLEEETIKTFHASRLSSLGEMASGVAHEINNPLTIIQGMTGSLLIKENQIDEHIRSRLVKIHSASERIAKIVKSMKLISSRSDQIEHENISVDKILEISIDLFTERFRTEHVHFQVINPQNPQVHCNPLQISQILINLLTNALDALQKTEEKNLLIHIHENHLFVEIRVINSGEPLSDTIAKRMFEPFYSTKALGKGTGLGLSISQTLAFNNGGSLSYEPYEGMISFVLKLRKAH
jgi:C4-dicarboxylate-specific signal transduction histidine kinase